MRFPFSETHSETHSETGGVTVITLLAQRVRRTDEWRMVVNPGILVIIKIDEKLMKGRVRRR